MSAAIDIAVDLAFWQGKIDSGAEVTASWKHEYEDGSGEYGPFRLADAAAAAGDPNLTAHEGPNGTYYTQPFGYRPAWEWEAPAWIEVGQARKIAQHLGLKLQES